MVLLSSCASSSVLVAASAVDAGCLDDRVKVAGSFAVPISEYMCASDRKGDAAACSDRGL